LLLALIAKRGVSHNSFQGGCESKQNNCIYFINLVISLKSPSQYSPNIHLYIQFSAALHNLQLKVGENQGLAMLPNAMLEIPAFY
jgi:hypothetical protein